MTPCGFLKPDERSVYPPTTKTLWFQSRSIAAKSWTITPYYIRDIILRGRVSRTGAIATTPLARATLAQEARERRGARPCGPEWLESSRSEPSFIFANIIYGDNGRCA